jgi:hypothetical protein
MAIVKIIWSYWEGNSNTIVDKCRGSWYEHAREWDIRILSKNDIGKYNIQLPSTFEKLPPTAKADVIRLRLLHKYGGLWMDASILLHNNLKWLEKYVTLHGTRKWYPFKISYANWPENSFLFSPKPNNASIGKWVDLLSDVLECWPNPTEHYVYKNKSYTHIPNYFMAFQALLYLMDVEKDSFISGEILPVNGVLAIIPFIIPSTLENRYFTKFINGGRRICEIQLRVQNYVMFIVLVFIIWKIFI